MSPSSGRVRAGVLPTRATECQQDIRNNSKRQEVTWSQGRASSNSARLQIAIAT